MSASVGVPSHESPRPVVLVVDDEEGVRAFFIRLLTDEGCTVHVASDGLSALTAVTKHAPDVVLLDVGIPGLDGFEVCRRLRREAATRLLPIVFVTAQHAREQRIEGLAAGADDFLTKPVDTLELLARVRSLARMKQYTDDLDSAASIIMTLATVIEARDGYSEGHCRSIQRNSNWSNRTPSLVTRSAATFARYSRCGRLSDTTTNVSTALAIQMA